ncbi:maleylpyruvate isomerase family mycothiol-dependent enzyme [Rhodococcus sp. KBS0724]|jgi:maleylpyruvate isomerase|uniref:maleylpyruvate isomerase family mycothiol-dependent enzyme n=1 Tax=Rhodococcus sp. KBS0724 TaxID=1179674 RepID=UPI00110E2461|nr:maleylpyruvate isomerase family mycothiol-dependent enzyme [Rhodococcus sp. KBS0724]TSD50009.1 maleylpyruvate isomerase family mycothiol-dependent enzyme [Rhodococcus sp. KBS0724]
MTDARRWMEHGTQLFLSGVDGLDDTSVTAPSGLPGWSRRHLLAHVAANAEALGNLVQWARTGDETPMYASADARARGIEEGSQLPAATLLAWPRSSADKLEAAMGSLADEQWAQLIVTAQGRTVPATEIPWMRAREVCVHAVDLGTGVTFADLPVDFLAALGDDIVGKRSAVPAVALRLEAVDASAAWDLPGADAPVGVAGPLADLVAYLSGRPHDLSTTDGSPVPVLPAWL